MRLAIVRSCDEVPATWLAGCALAVAVQLQRDVAPLWHLSAPEVDSRLHAGLDTVPEGAFVLTVAGTPDEAGTTGFHGPNGATIFAEGQGLASICRAISHEAVEALVDPAADRWLPGPCGQTQYAMEVCDPVQRDAYPIGDYMVSNFVLPAWFGGVGRFDFMGKLHGPWQTSPGGYLIVAPGAGEGPCLVPPGSETVASHGARTARRLAPWGTA